MKIAPHAVTIAELFEGYDDRGELGVSGFNGKLDIRPAYQREFVYDDKHKKAVIETVRKGYPLNTMYWAVAGDGFELMDGQQRTISICQYLNGEFAVDIDGSPMFFGNLTAERQQQIRDYDLSVYACEGSDGDKLDWFRVINISGLELKPQELRNAIYTGPWLTDAKKWFSKSGAPAYAIASKLVNGAPNRQEILERALDWIADGKIEDYMSKHQPEPDAQELWQYWQEVFAWVERVFPNQNSARARLMKGLPWGKFYNRHKGDKLNAATFEARIDELILDDEIGNHRGIYEYLLTGNERTLNLRAFDEKMRQVGYAKQSGICPHCPPEQGLWELDEMEADHIDPWHAGGKTVQENCQMLCKHHNRVKSGN